MTAPYSPPFSSSTSSATRLAACQESSLFAIRAIAGPAELGCRPHARLALTIPSSASGVVQWRGELNEPTPLAAALATTPEIVPVAHSNAAWWMLGCLTATVAALTVLAVSAPPTVVVRAPTIAVA
ncbi:MAG: hypothetical protein JKY37_30465, partial [Nannocystaceae bacterium]|nr:hypothetical protein [Nannocystaceae bacterium]